MFGLGGAEMLALLILGVLLFGKKLPEVGKSLGRSLVEFKKGLQGVEDEVAGHVNRPAEIAPAPRPPQRIASTAPKFDEPTDSEGKPRTA
jgi:sec-independent protein translocase protein TatA